MATPTASSANAFVRTLDHHNLVGSMSRVGACDNAATVLLAASEELSSSDNAGAAAKNCVSRSGSGLNGPTTVDPDASVDSPIGCGH